MRRALGIDGEKRKLLDSLHRFGKNLFSVAEAAKIMGISNEKARITLAYFTRRGWLARVKPGLYISVPLGSINPQEYEENPWVIANRIFSPCYIGGCSAAGHWGLTDQIFSTVFICTGKVFRRKRIKVQKVDYLLKLKQNITHTKSTWIENAKIQVSDPTMTIIDILDDPILGGGMRNAAEMVLNYFASEHRNNHNLIQYLKESTNRTIFKRLGYILEAFNIKAFEVIDICLKDISKGYSVFDPSVKNKGTYNSRWRLRVNVDISR
jgi:predicted transcriptional regulator of viral defense system